VAEELKPSHVHQSGATVAACGTSQFGICDMLHVCLLNGNHWGQMHSCYMQHHVVTVKHLYNLPAVLYILTIHCVQKKNTHSHFLLYLRGKCPDFHKIFRECLGGNKYSINGKVSYSLLPVTSCWRHMSMFVNYGFYRWRQTL